MPTEAEKALEIELSLEHFLDAIPGSIYWKDPSGIYLGCNQAVLVKGNLRSKSEIIGKTDFDIWPEMADKIRRVDFEVMSTRRVIEVEEKIILKNGEVCYFATVKKPLLDENGLVVGVIGNSTDITKLKLDPRQSPSSSQAKSEFQTLMSHEYYLPAAVRSIPTLKKKEKNVEFNIEDFLDSIPGSVYWKDVDGFYLGCNKTVLAKGNFHSKSEVIGKTDYDVWPDAAEAIRSVDQEVMTTKRVIEVEEKVTLKNGDAFHFSTVKRPLLNDDGLVVGVIGNSTDVTELKLAQQKAEAASQAKTQFLALMSHELRTPLTGIISTASMLVDSEDLALQPNEVRSFAKIIEKSGDYLLATINNILDFAKLEANKFDVVLAPCVLNQVIDEVVDILTSSANQKQLALSVTYEPNLPPLVMSDSRIIRHIMTNLIGNALKFTDKGSIQIKVTTLGVTDLNAKIQINIADTGAGIAEEKLALIFDKFFQAETGYTHKTSRLGTGLGLSIVKKLVDLLQGQIEVKSILGKGSDFIITLDFSLPFSQSHVFSE